MIQSALRICGLDPFVERPSPARHGASRIFCLLRASLLGGTALALLIGLGSGAWAQAQSQSVAGGAATGVYARHQRRDGTLRHGRGVLSANWPADPMRRWSARSHILKGATPFCCHGFSDVTFVWIIVKITH
jgi:hypothetical protein